MTTPLIPAEPGSPVGRQTERRDSSLSPEELHFASLALILSC
ncbi:MAG: hypothetical protein ABI586_03605 [Candidatus Nanopelagicales bacterium]